MSRRYFEFSEGSSNKFWEVWVEGNKVLTRYGKIGADGQTTVKDEGSPDGATKLHDKLVREKTGKGYAEKGGSKPKAAPKAAAAAAAPAPVAKAKPAAVEAGFRRFEFVEGGSSKFWEVKVDGEQQIIRFGKIGTAGQTKEKDFDSSGEAKADTKKLISEKTGKGYAEVGGKPKPEGNPQLEAAIEKNLDDSGSYLVLADWLQGKGDPHGELIMLQSQGKDAEAKALLKKHKDAFLGPYAGAKKADYEERGANIEWQFGFMKKVRLSWEPYEDGDSEYDTEEDLEQLLALPTARFIQSLELGPCPADDELSLQPIVDALVASKGPKSLRELYLGHLGNWDISGTETGDIDPLASLCPKLEKLTLHGGRLGLGKNLSMPELKELNLETGGLPKSTIKNLLSLKAPKLERLSLWFGSDRYGGDVKLKDLATILDGSAFPNLKHVGLMNCSWVEEIVVALTKSKLLPKITSLDLSMGCLSDKDIDFMLANKSAFAHLTHLNVEDSALTNASKSKVKALAKEVNFGKRQYPDRIDDPEYRYVSVSE